MTFRAGSKLYKKSVVTNLSNIDTNLNKVNFAFSGSMKWSASQIQEVNGIVGSVLKSKTLIVVSQLINLRWSSGRIVSTLRQNVSHHFMPL